MKKLLLLPIIFLFISCGITQSTPVKIDPISKSFQVDKEKDELYVSANNWMAENFVSSKSVIQFTDKPSGVVTGRYLLKQGYTYQNYAYLESEGGSVYAIIKIQVKDGAAKITLDPEEFRELDGAYINEKFKFTRETATNQINDLTISFEEYLKTDNSNNW